MPLSPRHFLLPRQNDVPLLKVCAGSAKNGASAQHCKIKLQKSLLVEELYGVPDGAVGDAAPLRLEVEHVVPVLGGLRTLGRGQLHSSQGTLAHCRPTLIILAKTWYNF